MTTPTRFINTTKWFLIFIGVHIMCWTLLPTLVRLNLPLDTLEGFTWGQQLQWGYDKDPLLNAWLTRLAIEIGGYHASFIYFFSQCAIAIGLWATWQLAKIFLPPLSALVAVIILEGVQYYNIAAIDFNDNVLQVMLWPLLSLAFYNAIKTQSWRDWLWVGLTAGLATLAKYYVIMLLLPMLLFLLINTQARTSFQKKGFYLGVALFGLLIAPHVYWLLQHDFLTIHYSFHQASPSNNSWDHLWQPIRFAMMQLVAFILPVLLLSSLCWGKKIKVLGQEKISLTRDDKQFLFFIGIGPLIANIIFAAITGNSVHVLWGMPLLSMWGIILLVLTRPVILAERFYRLIILIALLLAAAGVGYHHSLVTAADTSSANYPGKTIALTATHLWQANSKQPLRYVAGPRWLAGNIAFYAPSHPQVYMEWNSQVSTWINEQDIQQSGALFVWEATTSQAIPDELKARYPNLKLLSIETFAWSRTNNLKQIKIGFALLPMQ